jgi:hypothetical protein
MGLALYLLLLVFVMAPVAMVVEQVGIFKAIKQGLVVARATLGKLVLVSLALVLTLIPVILLVATAGFFQEEGVPLGLGWQLASMVLQGLASGLATILLTLAYVQVYRHRAGLTPPRP